MLRFDLTNLLEKHEENNQLERQELHKSLAAFKIGLQHLVHAVHGHDCNGKGSLANNRKL